MIRFFATAIVVACCVAVALPATAATHSKYLWATVNICDTDAYPDSIGVRASMPGDGTRTRMYMRITPEYYDALRQGWFAAGGSKWMYVGRGVYRWRQGGYTFAIEPPKGAQESVLRGAVDYKWTKGRRIVRTAHVITKGGHPGTKGADPRSYSKALCTISYGS
jgi:hypothetical protein